MYVVNEIKAMEQRTFDLSVPLSRLFIVGCILFGVIQIANGVFSIKTGDDIFGVVQLAFGLFFLLFVRLAPRQNRYVITFEDANLKIARSLSRELTISWASISEIHIQLMRVEIELDSGKRVKWNFNMSFVDNQMVKPEIIAALTEFAEAKGIAVRDSRAA